MAEVMSLYRLLDVCMLNVSACYLKPDCNAVTAVKSIPVMAYHAEACACLQT
jgi:hypothetical protein